jgi:hypothetical protein
VHSYRIAPHAQPPVKGMGISDTSEFYWFRDRFSSPSPLFLLILILIVISAFLPTERRN